MSHVVGSVEVGKMADLVLWDPANFGAKPQMVIKGGHIVASQMGDPNASIPTPQPVFMREMFGALGKAVGSTSIAFVSGAAKAAGVGERYGLSKHTVAVEKCRDLTKADMLFNDLTPEIKINPETFETTADGETLVCEPASNLPLAQKYFLF